MIKKKIIIQNLIRITSILVSILHYLDSFYSDLNLMANQENYALLKRITLTVRERKTNNTYIQADRNSSSSKVTLKFDHEKF